MMGINESTKSLLRDKLMKDRRKLESAEHDHGRKAVKRSVSPIPQRSKRRIIEDSVEQVLRDTIFQLSVNKLQFSRWKMHEPPLSRTVLIWNMVRVIDKEIQQEKVVDDVLSILGDESNVKFIKVCRTDCSGDSQRDSDRVTTEYSDTEEVEMSEPLKLVSGLVGSNKTDWNSAPESVTV